MMLPVGYLPCTQDPPAGKNMARVIDEMVVEAQAAEAAGWDGCFITEHHQQEDGYLPNPLLMAGLIGMKTQRMKVGTCVLLLPLYHPVRVAEDCAVLDQATKGRLILSVGVGYQQHDFDAFEVPIESRVRRTEEALEVLRRSWKGNRFSFDGTQFQLKDTLVTPPPFRPSGPPVWMASWTPPGLRRAARLADGWIADPVQSLPVIKGFR
jgi:alkanesulfonate monooxygenase SsuD/methylene tetrahydromethanopterin reductase-like flavin-dependent oxidoreductase (luciferase family)